MLQYDVIILYVCEERRPAVHFMLLFWKDLTDMEKKNNSDAVCQTESLPGLDPNKTFKLLFNVCTNPQMLKILILDRDVFESIFLILKGHFKQYFSKFGGLLRDNQLIDWKEQ